MCHIGFKTAIVLSFLTFLTVVLVPTIILTAPDLNLNTQPIAVLIPATTLTTGFNLFSIIEQILELVILEVVLGTSLLNSEIILVIVLETMALVVMLVAAVIALVLCRKYLNRIKT